MSRATKTVPEQHIARFDAYDFEWRFWGGEDVEDWIAANCSRPVLLQPVHQRLHFCFIEPDKTMSFIAWVLSHPQKRWIELKGQNQNDVWNWCRDNIKGEVDFYPSQSLTRVAFKEEKDEILFKLRWIGSPQ